MDITAHADALQNAVPEPLQTRVKVRWDEHFLYVGAQLLEPFVNGTLTGHNAGPPPYLDNDFEAFVDVLGRGEYYKEFEMNALNATYDVNWGRADCAPLACSHAGGAGAGGWASLPTCVNTSFHGYAGNWSMVNANASAPLARGMRTATAWTPGAFGVPTFPHAAWTLEIAFPIAAFDGRASGAGWRGGLLDADPVVQQDYNRAHPALGDAGPGRPRYWWVDFARAEHPLNCTFSDGSCLVCPFSCSEALATKTLVSVAKANMTAVRERWPTLLGGGYWEWVWGPVGEARPGKGYMHRPSTWPLLQFAPAPPAVQPLCRNIEFPGRHVALSVHLAQAAFALAHNGSFAPSLGELLAAAAQPQSTVCAPNLQTSDTCDLAALRLAADTPGVFEVAVEITANASVLTRQCTARPCYLASVRVTPPTPATRNTRNGGERGKGGAAAGSGGGSRGGSGGGGGNAGAYGYTVSINENRRVTVDHTDCISPCLDEA